MQLVFTLCFSSGRLCNEDCVVGNLLVKKGVQVLAQVYTMHHNAELWSNPEKFDPERYTNKGCVQTYVRRCLACCMYQYLELMQCNIMLTLFSIKTPNLIITVEFSMLIIAALH